MTRLDFNQVESCLGSLLRRGSITGQHHLDLSFVQRHGLLAARRACHHRRGLGFRSRGLRIGGCPCVVQVKTGKAIFFMDYINNFPEFRGTFRKMDTQLLRVLLPFRSDRDGF